jgi:hypothetical protein
VVAAAHGGQIDVTFRRDPNLGLDPPETQSARAGLTGAFWEVAEIDDEASGWTESRTCAARAPGSQVYKDLLVKREDALRVWNERPSEAQVEVATHTSVSRRAARAMTSNLAVRGFVRSQYTIL